MYKINHNLRRKCVFYLEWKVNYIFKYDNPIIISQILNWRHKVLKVDFNLWLFNKLICNPIKYGFLQIISNILHTRCRNTLMKIIDSELIYYLIDRCQIAQPPWLLDLLIEKDRLQIQVKSSCILIYYNVNPENEKKISRSNLDNTLFFPPTFINISKFTIIFLFILF